MYHKSVTLRRYLLICYIWTIVLFGLLGLVWSMSDPNVSALGLMLFGLLAGIANVFVNIWPWARRVPLERRTSFWSYRGTNIVFFAVPAGIVCILAVTAMVEAMIN